MEAKLAAKWSPEEISGWLARTYPNDPEMDVSHETIYQSLFVQGRGALRHELHVCLRSGRAMRRNKRWVKSGHGMGKIRDMVMIAERPAEAEDKAVPGHWEGDLIMGKGFTSVGTLVERQTRYLLLIRLPKGHGAEAFRDALTKRIVTLPAQFYDGRTEPSVSVPCLDFFGLPHGRPTPYVSALTTAHEGRGFNAYFPMPFTDHLRVELTNSAVVPTLLYYQIDYTLKAQTRVSELVPIRYGRMLVSPFTFYRGAALIMATDLATTPRSGLGAQVCGDAHLSNFGLFASPERATMFDVNDFDEMLPGPWEWDLKRLAASVVIPGRDQKFSKKDCAAAAKEVGAAYPGRCRWPPASAADRPRPARRGWRSGSCPRTPQGPTPRPPSPAGTAGRLGRPKRGVTSEWRPRRRPSLQSRARRTRSRPKPS